MAATEIQVTELPVFLIDLSASADVDEESEEDDDPRTVLVAAYEQVVGRITYQTGA